MNRSKDSTADIEKDKKDLTKRKLPDWLTGYLQYVDNTEPPLSYHIWTAIGTITSALQRKVYLRWGHETIYANQFIVLIGPSGRVRKTTALKIGKGFSTRLGLHIVPEKVTPEAFLQFMEESVDQYKEPGTGIIRTHCSVSAYSEELSVLLGQKNVHLLSNLTDLYDCTPYWKYKTKNSGNATITGVCINIIGATAPDWLPSMLPQEAIGGGWTSRVIFVVENKKRKIIANPNEVEIDIELEKSLLHDLRIINTLAGAFTMSEEAIEEYVTWYEKSEHEAERGNMAIADPRFGNYCSRRGTLVKKLSMAFAASRSNNLIIRPSDFQKSLALMEQTERKIALTFDSVGKARNSEALTAIREHISHQSKITRSQLLQIFYRDVDGPTLDAILKTLTEMKVIDKLVTNTLSNDSTYSYRKQKEKGI